MKIETFSIVAGSRVCNAKCPFCVSRMTGLELDAKEPAVNWRNFEKACRLAQLNNVTTVLITGKGEPTLFPNQISRFLSNLDSFTFPFIELQTNGLMLANGKCDGYLPEWYDLGLSTIALSLVHYKRDENHKIYQFAGTHHYDLPELIRKLHTHKFSVRLTVMLLEGFIDSSEEIENLVAVCKAHQVEQLTIRPIRRAKNSQDEDVSKWVETHGLPEHKLRLIEDYLNKEATLLMTLSHGARVYDLRGQNICLSDCLTIAPDGDRVRQLIFFPDGSLRYDWQYPGAILL